METICGTDCSKCSMEKLCKGCILTNGHPFGGSCVLSSCCNNKKDNNSMNLIEEYKSDLIDELNELSIKDMPKITKLYALNGNFINMKYNLPNGKTIKFWNDNDIYLGTQLEKNNSDRCYGIVADNNYLLICEYGKNGENPEIIMFKKR